MCGVLSGEQASKAWQRSLYEVAETGARHVSVYPLQLEESTPLASLVDMGLVTLPDEDVVADELEYGSDWLEREGLLRYEVANYAVPGHEAVHNTAYWLGRQYLGFGPGAHGMLDFQTASTVGVVDWESSEHHSRVRFSAPRSIEAWLTGEGQQIEVLSPREAAVEDVMLGLRLVRGVPAEQVSEAGLDRVLESLADDGLVEIVEEDARRWRTTRRGWLLGNEVFGRVWGAVAEDGDAPVSR
jgi:oxygen-independent coproporphyrinogen-3 oxidase